MTLDEYWSQVLVKRYSIYAILALMLAVTLLLFFAGQYYPIDSLDRVGRIVIIALFVLLAVQGFRLNTTRCYRCGFKLISGHFFRMKRIRCKRCGFAYADSRQPGQE